MNTIKLSNSNDTREILAICEGREPTDPVGPPDRDPGSPAPPPERRIPEGAPRDLIQYVENVTRVKVKLYSYLFDTKCTVARAAQELPSDPLADKLALAFSHALFNLAKSYDEENYKRITIHDKFGMGVIAQMLRYAHALEKTIDNDGLVNSVDDEVQITENIELYMKAYPLEDQGDLTEIAVIIGRCYVKAIQEIKVTAEKGELLLAHHHLLVAFDIVLEAMKLFANRRYLPSYIKLNRVHIQNWSF